MCEAEFASYAKENIHRKDPRVSLQQPNANCVWTTDRMLEMITNPNGRHWEAPPVLTGQQQLKPYNFDIRPTVLVGYLCRLSMSHAFRTLVAGPLS